MDHGTPDRPPRAAPAASPALSPAAASGSAAAPATALPGSGTVLAPPVTAADLGADLVRGLWRENGVFKQMLGLCPTLAVTTTAHGGLAMGLATMAVIVASNGAVSLVRGLIPAAVRIPCFIVIIATFVTVVDLAMNAFAHDLHKTLGLFIPLIVVNCIVLGRADAFASKRPLSRALADGFGVGLGFTMALLALGVVRELLGFGTVFGLGLLPASYPPFLLFVLPPGAFIALGVMLALMNRRQARLGA
jgi:electron transport complex protein RnfE